MNIDFTMRGGSAMARQRALMLVREAVAKREAELAAMPASKPSVNTPRAVPRPLAQGDK